MNIIIAMLVVFVVCFLLTTFIPSLPLWFFIIIGVLVGLIFTARPMA